MTDLQGDYQSKRITAEALVGMMRPGDVVQASLFYGHPQGILTAIGKFGREIDPLYVMIVHATMPWEFMSLPGVKLLTAFNGPIERAAQSASKNVYYFPLGFTDVQKLVRGWRRFDYFCMRVAPMDERGYFNCSTTGSWEQNAIRWIVKNSPETRIVLEANPNMPRVQGLKEYGNNEIHISDVHYVVEDESPLLDFPVPPPNEREQAIAANVAALVEDKATIQLGFGNIPMAIGHLIADRRDLGIHTEMFCEAHVDLIESGSVTNAHKGLFDGISVGTFAVGEARLRKFLDGNREFAMLPVEVVNNVCTLARIKRVTSINSVIMVDLAGQACAHCIGSKTYSGVGGAFEFAYGSQLSEGGKSIICLPSTVTLKDGRTVSNIVPQFEAGTRITLPEHTVDWVVTEYGAIRVKTLTLEERASALIRVAHPDHRDEIARQAVAHGLRLDTASKMALSPSTYVSGVERAGAASSAPPVHDAKS